MLKLADIFQNNMVLQREKPLRIWGTTNPEEQVTVCIQGKTACATANASGDFVVVTEPLCASVEETLLVKTQTESLTLTHVAVGEVWIAGGQSNMEFFMAFEKHLPDALALAPNPSIRFYDVPEIAFDGQEDCFDYSEVGIWRSADPDNIPWFSAVGYYFAQQIHTALEVPVGVIGCNWGGTRTANWMKPETVREVGPLWLDVFQKALGGTSLDAYYEAQRHNPMNDRGRLLDNPFYQFMMPKTPTPEECFAFLSSIGEGPENFGTSLLPENVPGSLYTHMLLPIGGFTARGVLWYQGESDDDVEGGPSLYSRMLSAMIRDWRSLWDDSLPFLLVQLPGFERWLESVNHDYVTIRQAQQQVADETESVYLCAIGDVGERYDIHPKDKKTVGTRLALLALSHLYGQLVLGDAPRLRTAHRDGGSILLCFDHAGDGLRVQGDALEALTLRANGDALAYTWEILGDTMRITPKQIPDAVITVSHAWTAWYQINLLNSAGIPALPFEICV